MLTEGYTEKIIFEQRPGGHGTIRQKKKKKTLRDEYSRQKRKQEQKCLSWVRENYPGY